MMFNLSSTLIKTKILSLAILFLSAASAAQFDRASPPIADPSDRRFEGVTEDLTTPSLKTSHLMPAQPLIMIDDSHPDYTVDLVQLQWRWGDPLDVYLIKPVNVKNPPVILNLYGYPA